MSDYKMVNIYSHSRRKDSGVCYLGIRVEGEVVNTRNSAGELTCGCVKVPRCVHHSTLESYLKHTCTTRTEQSKINNELIQPGKCERTQKTMWKMSFVAVC